MALIRWNEFQSNALGSHAMPYRCAHCGHETVGHAYAAASGTGISAYGLDDDGAAQRAHRHASASASARAELLIRLAPCPRCRGRDRRTLRRIHRNTFLVCLAMFAVPMLAFAWNELRWTRAVLIADAVIALVITGIPMLLFCKYRASRLTSGRVWFDGQAAPVSPPGSRTTAP